MTRLPQVLRNVAVAERGPTSRAVMADDVAAEEASAGRPGRVLVRPSGTEPLVRVMVEAETQAERHRRGGSPSPTRVRSPRHLRPRRVRLPVGGTGAP